MERILKLRLAQFQREFETVHEVICQGIYEDFLRKLRRVPVTWSVVLSDKGRLRIRSADDRSPLATVSGTREIAERELAEPPDSGSDDPYDGPTLYVQIAWAQNGGPNADQEIRADLLAACGLPAEQALPLPQSTELPEGEL